MKQNLVRNLACATLELNLARNLACSMLELLILWQLIKFHVMIGVFFWCTHQLISAVSGYLFSRSLRGLS